MAAKRKKVPASRSRKAKRKTTPSRIGSFIDSVRRQHGAAFARGTMFLVLTAAAVMVVTIGLRAMQRKVLDDQQAAVQREFCVELVGAPDWMPQELHRDIVKNITPGDRNFGSKAFCGEVFKLAKNNPWIADVLNVRKIQTARIDKQNVVIVRAKFRKPFARAPFEGGMVYFDEHGFVLPSRFVPRWETRNGAQHATYLSRYQAPQSAARIHYITVKGVGLVPPIPGEKWNATELAAGIEMIKLVKAKPYAHQITVADVQNYGNRISDTAPQLVYYAQVGRDRQTTIRLGRFPRPEGGDWVVPPETKMQRLDEYVSRNRGRLAGKNEYIDLRFDELIVSVN
ncbi:MAG: hypothetical protein KAR11_03235 [Phycisphaerae bacterium]|nr:hypothetical protein [Phycisphaerae bacterium]